MKLLWFETAGFCSDVKDIWKSTLGFLDTDNIFRKKTKKLIFLLRFIFWKECLSDSITERNWPMQTYHLLIKVLHSVFIRCFKNPPLLPGLKL